MVIKCQKKGYFNKSKGDIRRGYIESYFDKLKIENEELKKHVDKRRKLIIDLKDRCNKQKKYD